MLNELNPKATTNKVLLGKLIEILMPNVDRKFHEKYLNYFMRFLGTNTNLSCFINESTIVNYLENQLTKIYPNNPYPKLEKLQNKLALLSSKKTFFSKRWAVLFLLLKLSNETNEYFLSDGAKTLQNLFTAEESDNILFSNTNNKLFKNPNAKFENNGEANFHSFAGFHSSKKIIENNNNKKNRDLMRSTQNNIVVTDRSAKKITEFDIINDLIFVFQGIDGHFINYNNLENAFTLNSLIPWTESISDIVPSLCELGWLYKKVSGCLNAFRQANVHSQFIQSFYNGVQTELNEYYKLISILKKMNSKIEELDDENTDYSKDLTLKKLLLWTSEPIERMKWLACSCDIVSNLRGLPIVSTLYSYVQNCGAEKFLSKVLETTSRPLFIILANWLLYGQLLDPYKEFFIEIRDDVTDDEIWTKRYNLIAQNVPMFLSKEVAIKIFEIGKCVNFIQKYCDEANFSLMKLKQKLFKELDNYEKIKDGNINESNKMNIEEPNNVSIPKHKTIFNNLNNNNFNPSTHAQQKNNPENNLERITRYKKALNFLSRLEDISKLNFSILPEIYSEIDAVHKEINKELVNIIYNKFKFMLNLQSINRYLLLGQGDMWQYLMDLLYDELKKPANQIYKHNLLSILDSAIKASNAQFHDPDCLRKLNIKLMDISMGDTGWDIFVMEYNVESPLTVIFSKDLLKSYQTLFFFFWKLKRLEYSQNQQIWRNFMTYSHGLKGSFESLRPHIHKSMLFNQKIIQFVSTLHNYFSLEVLETQYKKLVEKLGKIEYLDDLIETHREFVDAVIDQSLLNQDNSSLYKKILEIFELIFRFKTSQEVLITTIFEDYYKKVRSNTNISHDDYVNEDNNNISIEKNLYKQAYEQISKLYEEFLAEISNLINHIETIGSGNLKFLKMLLDYNNYYSDYTEAQELYNQKNNSNDENNFDGDENENFEDDYENGNYGDSNNNNNEVDTNQNYTGRGYSNSGSRPNNNNCDGNTNLNNSHSNNNLNNENFFRDGEKNKNVNNFNTDYSNIPKDYNTKIKNDNPFLNESRDRNTGNNINNKFDQESNFELSDKKNNLLNNYNNNYDHEFSDKKNNNLDIDQNEGGDDETITIKRIAANNKNIPENNNYIFNNNLTSSNFLGNTSPINNIQNETSFSRKNDK